MNVRRTSPDMRVLPEYLLSHQASRADTYD